MKKNEENRDSSAISSNEAYATAGPLYTIFGNSRARLLDQCLLVGGMEQTISMLKESTNLAYKTVDKEVKHLLKLGLMVPSRKMGNARTFRFRVDNHLSALIACADKMNMDELKKALMAE